MCVVFGISAKSCDYICVSSYDHSLTADLHTCNGMISVCTYIYQCIMYVHMHCEHDSHVTVTGHVTTGDEAVDHHGVPGGRISTGYAETWPTGRALHCHYTEGGGERT